jgi:hypothetical protein
MGMYSFFDHEDIEIIDYEGLVNFLEEWENNPEFESWKELMSKKALLNEEKRTLSFESWSDIKLISYWYPPQVVFLNSIARFIEGYVAWTFETSDEAGSVHFEDGKAEFRFGVMDWHDWKAEDLISKRDMSDTLQRYLAVSNLVTPKE